MSERNSVLTSARERPAIEVRELDAPSVTKWNEFVATSPEATFYHRSEWKTVIERVFGHSTHYLLAEAEGKIEGVLPLGHIRSRLFGNALISTPFCVYGGVAASSTGARLALEEAAEALAQRLGVDYLEHRDQLKGGADWPSKDLYVTFKKKIDPDPDDNLRAIPRRQRAMVRKGIKAGLESQLDDDVDRFFEAYAQSVHNLGTPVFSKKLFITLREVFGRDCEILTVTKDDRVVGSVLSFYFRDQILPYYGGGTKEARAVAGNDFMYWEVMRRACERGVRLFDYGRSKRGTGAFSFKKNWGFEPKPLPYKYRLVKAKDIPNVSPLNPKYRIFVNMWKRLPFSLSKILGPPISRNLG